MRSCWHENPDYRPNFDELKEKLKILIKYEEKKILSIQLSDSDEFTSADLSGSFNWELPNQDNQQTSITNSMTEQNLEATISYLSLDVTEDNSEKKKKKHYSENQTSNLESSQNITSIQILENGNMQNETVIVNENEENENVIKNVSIELLVTDYIHSNEEVLLCSYPQNEISRTPNNLISQHSSDKFSKYVKQSSEVLTATNLLSSNSNDKFISNSNDLFELEMDKSSWNKRSRKYTHRPNLISVNISKDPETEL